MNQADSIGHLDHELEDHDRGLVFDLATLDRRGMLKLLGLGGLGAGLVTILGIHFEVYPRLELATDEGNKIATSRVALPKKACYAVYATEGCAESKPPSPGN